MVSLKHAHGCHCRDSLNTRLSSGLKAPPAALAMIPHSLASSSSPLLCSRACTGKHGVRQQRNSSTAGTGED
eukprot:521074-Rhodomonas_salina.1